MPSGIILLYKKLLSYKVKNDLIARANYPTFGRKRTWAEQNALSSMPAAGEQLACKLQACCVATNAVVWRAPKALCSIVK